MLPLALRFAIRTAAIAGVIAVAACTDDPATPPPPPPPAPDAATPPVGAEATIGAAGGALSFGPIAIEVPPGAVTAPTLFRIRPASTAPRLDARLTVVSELYRLEPAQAFAVPVRVSVAVDRARVPAGVPGLHDGVLLMKAPSGTDDFEPVGAAGPTATTVVGSVTSFSEVVAVFLRLVGCQPVASDACMGTCDRRTSVCAGSCTLRTDDAAFTASCTANTIALEVSCTCSSDDPRQMPVVTGPLSLPELLAGQATLTAYTFLVRCGWPCGTPVGTDAGQPDADLPPSDGGPGPPDSGEVPATWMPELIASSADWDEFVNFRVAQGWITWAEPSQPRVRAVQITGQGSTLLSETTGSYARLGLTVAMAYGGQSELGITQIPSTMPTFPAIDDPVRMITRPVFAEPTYLGVTATTLLFNDPGTDAMFAPFVSVPIAGGRTTVLDADLAVGRIEVAPTGTYYYAFDRMRPDTCGLYAQIGGRVVPDEAQCRSALGAIRVVPTHVVWAKVNANSMTTATVFDRGGNAAREFPEVSRAFAPAGQHLYYYTSGNDLARTRLSGDGSVVEMLGVTVQRLSAMETGDDGYLYWATFSQGMGSLYRMRLLP